MKIEKNIPIPECGAGRPPKYPFQGMSVGDSVFVEGENSQGKASRASIQTGIRHGMKFKCRTLDGGVRIWRVE